LNRRQIAISLNDKLSKTSTRHACAKNVANSQVRFPVPTLSISTPLKNRRQIVVKSSSNRRQIVVKSSSNRRQIVVKSSSNRRQIVVKS
jgi:hypothetical protein